MVIFKWSRKKVSNSCSIIIGLIFMLLLSMILIVSPSVGVSDNGFYAPQVYTNNFYYLEENEPIQFSGYFVPQYGESFYFNEYSDKVTSSLNLFVSIAKVMDRIFTGKDGIFDIRFLSAIYIIYAGMTVFLLSKYFLKELSIFYGILLSIIFGLMIIDTSYSLYYNSFSTLPILVLSSFNACIWLLYYFNDEINIFVSSVGIVVNISILIFAENIYGGVGVILFSMLLILALIEEDAFKRHLLSIVSSVVLIVSIMSLLASSNVVTHVDKYHSVTKGILETSQNPEETLESYEKNSNFSLLTGNLFYEDYAVIEPENDAVRELYDDMSQFDILKYYIVNPHAFMELLKDTFSHAYELSYDKMGNYQQIDNPKPYAKYIRFKLFGNLKSNLYPKTIGSIFVWIGIVVIFTYKKPKQLVMLLFLLVAGVYPFLVGIIRSGLLNIYSYAVLYNVFNDVITIIIISSLVQMRSNSRKKTI